MRKEAELQAGIARHQAGESKPRSVGYLIGRLKLRFARSAEHAADSKDYVRERMRMLFITWPALFRMDPRGLTAERIEAWKQGTLAKRAPSTVRGALIYLGQALGVGVEPGVCTSNPCRGGELPKSESELKLSDKHQISTETWDLIVAEMRRGPGGWRHQRRTWPSCWPPPA